MKRNCFFILLMTMALATSAKTSIDWLGTVHDFGAFSEDDEKVVAYFRFVNSGDEEVSITQVGATCGCTVPKYSTDPVAPGDTATILVAYNPVGRPGRFEKNIYVRTTANDERTKLAIKGVVIGGAETVKARYPVSLGSLKLRSSAVMLGRVTAGHKKTENIDGYNNSRDSLHLVFSNLPGYIDVAVIPEIVPPGEMANIGFTINADKAGIYGIVTDSVEISVNGSAPVALPVVAIVEEDFSALTPEQLALAPSMAIADRIDLGEIEVGTDIATGEIEVLNRGENPLEIRRVYSQDPLLRAEVDKTSIAKGKKTRLRVWYQADKLQGKMVDSRLSIVTNDPSHPTRAIRVVGLVKQK